MLLKRKTVASSGFREMRFKTNRIMKLISIFFVAVLVVFICCFSLNVPVRVCLWICILSIHAKTQPNRTQRAHFDLLYNIYIQFNRIKGNYSICCVFNVHTECRFFIGIAISLHCQRIDFISKTKLSIQISLYFWNKRQSTLWSNRIFHLSAKTIQTR